ncbi:hypothetical protein HBO32_26610 [Pseudomonas nitroreducens]|uniref:hypothetical protein n=2 Tax=Pseudomonas nitroreducens TaxID=46680 RepID=UPI001473880F|nr:hypothetical protein [Pseudomonas nitroreducens]MDG9856971.1 hypothetical protein [Pseudomonas nitroreducens]NMZ76683.1 hypothetical protein [Pseudomonas nitroreducens]
MMFKSLSNRIKHSLSNDVADWMQALRREDKFHLLLRRVGQGLLDAFEHKMDIRSLYIVVSDTGTVGFTLRKVSPNGKPLIACVALWYSTGIVEYIQAYHNDSVTDYEFQKIQNAMACRITINILNQIYGDNYITY